MLHVRRSRGRLAGTFAALLGTAGELLAQDHSEVPTAAAPVADARDWIGGAPLWQWSRLTGDWAGWRSELEAAGIEIAGSVTWDWSAASRSGRCWT